MKTPNMLFALILAATFITSCKKEKDDPAPQTPTTPTSNYYIFNGSTYTYAQGWGQGAGQFNFFSDDPNSNNGIRLYFKGTSPAAQPAAGTYSVIPHVNYISDSTTCSVIVHKDTTDYISIGGGVITVGKSGSKTTYDFTALPLSGSSTVSGTFIY